MKFFRKFNNFFQTKRHFLTIDNLALINEIHRKRRPKSYWDHAIAQYQCQITVYQNRHKLVAIFPALFLFVIGFNLVLLWKAIRSSFKCGPEKRDKTAALLPDKSFVPDIISGDVEFLGKWDLNPHFTLEDWWYGLRLSIRYVVYPYFVAKSLHAIYQHSGIRKSYSKVLVSNEYSFCSSVITHYISRSGAVVINCMHGEKLINARDAFCCYDMFIVWDQHYVEIFKEMYVDALFVVSHCPALRIERSPKKHEAVSYFLQGDETQDQIKNILNKLEVISLEHGCDKVWLKPHPRYITWGLEELVGKDRIYRGDTDWLVSQSKIVCSRYSTILFQVYASRGSDHQPLIYLDDEFWNVPSDYIMAKKVDGFFSLS